MRYLRDRRRAQSGQSLVEVLVSLVIASLALSLIVGTLSTGLLDATLAKRNTAVQAVLQYEIEAVSASTFNSAAPQYSDCFATEAPTTPTTVGYTAACPSGPYTLRADATWRWLPSPPNTVQVWTITISAWPSGASIGKTISTYKVNR
ncbi:MAG TPA: prepilin-type N-terminal cleavage/methylation domain-containing protein [Candidatus Dormibacteraeota bacterium]|nr:prepilin-type N-terminal cleavage/methylation domain-containing protein [Candidatus Dormibacteraeota bacterium]